MFSSGFDEPFFCSYGDVDKSKSLEVILVKHGWPSSREIKIIFDDELLHGKPATGIRRL